MLGGLLTFLGICLAAVWLIVAYNQVVSLRQRVTKDWAELDRLLRQRHDELSQLGELCARHLERERPALDRLAEARSAVFGARHAQDAAALGREEGDLRRAPPRYSRQPRRAGVARTQRTVPRSCTRSWRRSTRATPRRPTASKTPRSRSSAASCAIAFGAHACATTSGRAAAISNRHRLSR
jgi:hypothetical protein